MYDLTTIKEKIIQNSQDLLWNLKQIQDWKGTLRKFVILIACFSFFINFLLPTSKIVDDQYSKVELIKLWFEQLPDDHWIKSDNLTNEEVSYIKIWMLENTLKDIAFDAIDTSITTIEYRFGIIGKIISIHRSNAIKADRNNYLLQNTSNKVFSPSTSIFSTKIKLSVSDKLKLNFIHIDKLMTFDVTRADLSMNSFDSHSKDLTTKHFVISYIEDPSIAKITNGTISAISKGKTKLIIGVNNHVFKYDVTVK